jgi:hypothetical protein
MEKVNTYLIKWYGPFKTRQLMKEWEDGRSEIFNLYVFQAKHKSKKDRYYCGMTLKQTVGKRMSNYNHHIHEFENEKSVSLQIWIGTIANKRATENDVRICENIITIELASISVGEKYLENRTNKKAPVNDVYIFNEWLRDEGHYIMKRQRGSVPAVIPEAMVYYCETKALFGVNHLKSYGELL